MDVVARRTRRAHGSRRRFYNEMTKQQRKETKDLAPDPSVLSSAAAGRMNAKGLSGGRGASRWRREPRDKGKGVGEGVLRGSGRLAWGGRRQGCDQALSRCSAPSPEHEAVALEGGGGSQRRLREITNVCCACLCVHVYTYIYVCVSIEPEGKGRTQLAKEGEWQRKKAEVYGPQSPHLTSDV